MSYELYQICYHCGHEIARGRGEIYEIDGLFGPLRRWCHYYCRKEERKDKVSDKVRFRPRNDKVLIRIDRVDEFKGLIMPESSVQGKRYIVEAIGPDVKDLKPGDCVFISGEENVDFARLPTDSSRLIIGSSNVEVVIEPITEAGKAYDQVDDEIDFNA